MRNVVMSRVMFGVAALAFSAVAIGASSNQTARTVWDGVYSDAQASRGKAAYQKDCASCHLESLGGADMAPGLAGDAFMETWNDLSVGEMFERVRISMPQDRPASLPRQQYADIVAYMLQVNHFPSGPAELPQELPALNAIKVLTKRPAER